MLLGHNDCLHPVKIYDHHAMSWSSREVTRMSLRHAFAAVLGLAVTAAGNQPAAAWEKARALSYDATSECPDADNLCVFVSCPVSGKPAFELLMYEHGRGMGEEIVIEVDGRTFPLDLPERGAHDLYRWPLESDFASALRDGRRARIVVDPGTSGTPISLRGSGKAIRSVMTACGGEGATAGTEAAPVASKTLSGLSDNADCAYASTEGVVTERTLTARGRDVEGFRFEDQYGISYINVSLPDGLPRAREVHRQLKALLVRGQRLRIGVHGCGAAARIEVLDSVQAIQ